MTKIYAHRGASSTHAENTLPAFAEAVRVGANGIELDVHLTRDGVPVVTHDDEIDRVSDGHGLVANMTLDELRRFDFGILHSEHGVCPIPTLREVYELIQPTNLHINIELKTSPNPYPGIEKKVHDLTVECGMRDRVLYSSFNHITLMTLRGIDPAAPIGLLYSAPLARPWDYAVMLGANALHPYYLNLHFPDYVMCSRSRGIAVNTWTVDKPEHLKWVAGLGVDIVITNCPGEAIAALK